MENKIKQDLQRVLEKHDYDGFKNIIDDLQINKDDFESYLNSINDAITEQMLKEPFGGNLNSGKRVLNAFNEKSEETFFDVIPKMKKYVTEVFKKKLSVNNDNYVDDSPIKQSLDSFESRFM